MIISHAHKFIFLKTKKTAGTSVEIALSEFCGESDVITRIFAEDEARRRELGFRGPQHQEVPREQLRLRERAGALLRRAPLCFENHAPADFVRAHVDPRIWRDYFKFSFERNPYDKAISRYYWSTRKLAERPSIADYLAHERPTQISSWPIYAIGEEIAVDFVGRYEHLSEDLRKALRQVGIAQEPTLPTTKAHYRTDRRHYSEVLDARARATIERLCARELAAFGYAWEVPT